MGSNWMWGLILVAAMAHALRWVPGTATLRQVKIPAAFVVLYVVYALVLSRGGLLGLLIGFVIVELLLQLYRRSRPERARDRTIDASMRRRR